MKQVTSFAEVALLYQQGHVNQHHLFMVYLELEEELADMTEAVEHTGDLSDCFKLGLFGLWDAFQELGRFAALMTAFAAKNDADMCKQIVSAWNAIAQDYENDIITATFYAAIREELN